MTHSFVSQWITRLKKTLKPPSTTLNTQTRRNHQRICSLLTSNHPTSPQLLLIGGGDRSGEGLQSLGSDLLVRSINLEISPGPAVDVVGDGHLLPFVDGGFDAVLSQAVLEHVANPAQVVAEAWRVLRPGGYIYVEIPFLQCYHPHPTDFQRYTIEGIERLLGRFEKIDSGVCVGPSSVLGDMLKYYLALLLSLNNNTLFHLLRRGLGWFLFPIKYLDLLLANHVNARFMASGLYYLGQKPR